MAKKRRMEAKADQEVVAEAPVEYAPIPRAWEEKPELRGNDRSYPEEIRDEFFRRVLENGENVAMAARGMDIPLRSVQEWIAELKQEREPQIELENVRIADLLGQKAEEFLRSMNKEKLEKTGVRDLAIAAGIALDKRKDMLGPQKSGNISRLRIAWKDGTGAVELETGG